MEDRIPAALQFNSDSVPWKSIPAIIAELRKHWTRVGLQGEEQHLQFLLILNHFLCPFDSSEEKDSLDASRFFKRESGIPLITGAGSRQNHSKCTGTLCGLLLAEDEFLIKEAWGTLLQTHLAAASSAEGLSVANFIFRLYNQLAPHSKAFGAATLDVVNSPPKLRSVLALDVSPWFQQSVTGFFLSLCVYHAPQLLVEDGDDSWCDFFAQILDRNIAALRCRAPRQCSDIKIAARLIVDQIRELLLCVRLLFDAEIGRRSARVEIRKGEYSKSFCQVFLKAFPTSDHLNDLFDFDDVFRESCFSSLASCVSVKIMGDDAASSNTSSICDDERSAALTCFQRVLKQLLVAEPKDWTRIERHVVFLADLASKALDQATLRLIQQASLIEIVRQAWFLKGSTMKIQSEISFLLSNVLASVDSRQARNIFDEETGIPISEILQRPTEARVTSEEKLDLMYVIGYLLKPLLDGENPFEHSYFATPTALFAVIEACSGSRVEKRQLKDLRESLYVISVVLKMNVTSYDFMWLLLFGSNDSSISASGASLQSSLDKLTTAEQKIHSLYPWLERVRTHSTLKKQDITDIDALESLVTRFRKTISSCRALVKFICNSGFHIRSQMDKSRAKKRQNIVQMCWEYANQEQFVNKDEDVEKKRRDCKTVLNGLSEKELRVLFTERFNSNCMVPEQWELCLDYESESHQRYLVNLSRAIAFDVSVRTESLNEGRTEKIATEEIVLQMCEPLLINKEILEKKKILGLKNVSPGTEWQTPVNFREVFSKEGQKLLQQLADLCQRKRQQRIRKRGLDADLRFPLECSLSFVMFLCVGIKLDELKWLA